MILKESIQSASEGGGRMAEKRDCEPPARGCGGHGAVFLPVIIRPALVIAAASALVIWVAGEHFGELLSGSATDPNTGPLLVLIAVAFWPGKGGPGRHDRLVAGGQVGR